MTPGVYVHAVGSVSGRNRSSKISDPTVAVAVLGGNGFCLDTNSSEAGLHDFLLGLLSSGSAVACGGVYNAVARAHLVTRRVVSSGVYMDVFSSAGPSSRFPFDIASGCGFYRDGVPSLGMLYSAVTGLAAPTAKALANDPFLVEPMLKALAAASVSFGAPVAPPVLLNPVTVARQVVPFPSCHLGEKLPFFSWVCAEAAWNPGLDSGSLLPKFPILRGFVFSDNDRPTCIRLFDSEALVLANASDFLDSERRRHRMYVWDAPATRWAAVCASARSGVPVPSWLVDSSARCFRSFDLLSGCLSLASLIPYVVAKGGVARASDISEPCFLESYGVESCQALADWCAVFLAFLAGEDLKDVVEKTSL